ncbi:response regulator [Halomonas sp. MCCC 1A17488]|uniref:response regulator n=1 Tax=unclassified Halomonas TaxID=2609666 RepID=UPI0018D273BF|nr:MULTISPECIES: response regulator [unclassified Halomonas]MCE8018172.1 response regulator [Halomonas sp. MCCC 1A17488]MCG3241505.1 response regulator [Halomonas sp. MCCC 1A17488]QPP48539.1 response regulator [Halomonas sp. SS10-MC5]
MPVGTRKDRFWSHLIWPLLWPLLLAQAALVLLCLLVGVVLWVATPDPTSWAESAWLLLALLAGTTLTVSAFLLQLRHSLRDYEGQIEGRLGRIERLLQETEQSLPRWLGVTRSPPDHEDPVIERLEKLHDGMLELQSRLELVPKLDELLMASQRPALLLYHGRIVGANLAMEQLLGESQETLAGQDPATRLIAAESSGSRPGEVQVMDGEGRWRSFQVEWWDAPPYQLSFFERAGTHDLGGLLAARERAREDSRLKSRYLTLLQRELEPLLSELAREMKGDDDSRSDPCRHAHLSERIADILLLISSLAGEQGATALRDMRLPSGQAAPLRVLVVDDGPVNRMLASQVMERQGLRVDCVASGLEALEQQHRQAYDLVLMDIFMPGMDGVEAARRWREQEAQQPDAGRSVLVALTANATESDRRRFDEAGMDDYLAKPYGPRELIELLQRWRPDAFEESPVT